jgi:hypothetical protein
MTIGDTAWKSRADWVKGRNMGDDPDHPFRVRRMSAAFDPRSIGEIS